MKICALLVPKEMKLEQSGGVKAMTDEQLDQAMEALRELLAQRERAASLSLPEPTIIHAKPLKEGAVNVIDGTAGPVALPRRSPSLLPRPSPPRNRTAQATPDRLGSWRFIVLAA
jgi:hypothetical protein